MLPSMYVESFLCEGMYMQVFTTLLEHGQTSQTQGKKEEKKEETVDDDDEKEEEEEHYLDRFQTLTRSDTYTHSQLEAINEEFNQYLYDPPESVETAYATAHLPSQSREVTFTFICETCIAAASKSSYILQTAASGKSNGESSGRSAHPLSLTDIFGSPLKAADMCAEAPGAGEAGGAAGVGDAGRGVSQGGTGTARSCSLAPAETTGAVATSPGRSSGLRYRAPLLPLSPNRSIQYPRGSGASLTDSGGHTTFAKYARALFGPRSPAQSPSRPRRPTTPDTPVKVTMLQARGQQRKGSMQLLDVEFPDACADSEKENRSGDSGVAGSAGEGGFFASVNAWWGDTAADGNNADLAVKNGWFM